MIKVAPTMTNRPDRRAVDGWYEGIFLMAAAILFFVAVSGSPLSAQANRVVTGQSPPHTGFPGVTWERVPTHPVADSVHRAKEYYRRASSTDSSVWKFSVLVGMNHMTLWCFPTFDSACNAISTQIDSVNSRFNTPGVFDRQIEFVADSFYVFYDIEPIVSRPGFDFVIHYYDVYSVDESPLTSWGAYWGPPLNTIYLVWSFRDSDGPTGSWPTDILVHEFGHTRGAIDQYATYVPGHSNPVSGDAYPMDSSIMGSTDLAYLWDEHSINIINWNADRVITSSTYLSQFFPDTMGIQVITESGDEVAGAQLALYPVEFYTFEVDPVPVATGITAVDGRWLFDGNPFGPNWPMNGVGIRNANLLIECTLPGDVNYCWLPLPDVQNAWFVDSTQSLMKTIVVSDALPVRETEPPLPVEFVLRQNYPNPFNATTVTEFAVERRTHVRLTVFDLLGRQVAVLADEVMPAGTYQAMWDGRVYDGMEAATGVYFYRMEADAFVATKKMVLLR